MEQSATDTWMSNRLVTHSFICGDFIVHSALCVLFYSADLNGKNNKAIPVAGRGGS
jgi:hypothetical protein